MNVVAYVRVSTTEQAENGLGLDIQEEAVRQWAEQNGHTVTAVFRDEGISGSNGLEDRVGLADAMAVVTEGDAGALVVYRLDRLARGLVLQETLLRQAWRADAEVFSTAGGETNLKNDPDDPSRALIRQVLGAVAEYERAMISLRLRAGRRRKKRQGGHGEGAPPYGWQATGGWALEPVPDEQAVISRARKLRATGATLRQVAELLNADGVPTKRDGGRWHAATVSRMLAR